MTPLSGSHCICSIVNHVLVTYCKSVMAWGCEYEFCMVGSFCSPTQYVWWDGTCAKMLG